MANQELCQCGCGCPIGQCKPGCECVEGCDCGCGCQKMDEKIVGVRIAQGRQNANLSQAQFAKLLHVSAQAVGKWERNESLPDIFMLGKIGEIIGTTDINYFLGKTPCTCKYCDCCKADGAE